MSLRLISLGLLIAAWFAGAHFAGGRLLPGPPEVALALLDEARSGALAFNLAVTLGRVAAAFAIAMALGSAIGLVMGRSPVANRLGGCRPGCGTQQAPHRDGDSARGCALA